MSIKDDANTVFRDYATAGVPASGVNEPAKKDIRNLFATVSDGLASVALAAAGGAIIYATRAELYADLAHAANTQGIVWDDSNDAYNGVYKKLLGSGSGSWSFVASLPDFFNSTSFQVGTNTGGTANVITATTDLAITESQIISLPIAATTTASPVTVAFNGGSALTIKTPAGEDPAIGSLMNGMMVVGFKSGSQFRLLTGERGATGATGPIGPTGLTGVNNQGTWAPGPYYQRDIVWHVPTLKVWYASTNTSGVPGVSSDWILFADLSGAMAAQLAAEAAADAAAASEANAANSATSAATAEGAAAAQVVLAANETALAEAARIAAQAAASQAIAAAEASGNIAFYATKSAANTALSGLSNGQVIEVTADESLEGRVTRYVKTSGSYVFMRYMPMYARVFCRSNATDDTGDGLTWATAKKTLQGMAAILSSATEEIILGRGSVWYAESLAIPTFAAAPFATIRAGGQGRRPTIDGSKAFVAGDWTQPDAVTYPNVWKQTIVFPVAINNQASQIWQPAVYDEGSRDRVEDVGLTRRISSSTIATNLAAVQANPGSFTCHKTGDTQGNPQTVNLTGTSWDFYVHLRDSGNPTSTGRTIRTVDQRLTCIVGPGQDYEDIRFRRTGSKDFVGRASFVLGVDSVGSFKGCVWEEAAIHGAVVEGAFFENCRMLAAYHGGPIASGGGAFHQFRPTGTIGVSKGFECRNLYARGFFVALYSHGAGASPIDGSAWEHDTFDVDGLTSIDCRTVIDAGQNLRGVRARRVFAVGFNTIFSGPHGVDNVFEDSKLFAGAGASGTTLISTFAADMRIKFINSLIVTHPSGQSIFADYDPGATAANRPKLTLVNSTMSGLYAYSAPNRSKLDLTLVNSYFGIYRDSNSGGPWITGTVTADATSVIECSHSSSETVVAAHAAVNTAATIGINRQLVERVITAADIGFFNIRGGADATFRNVSYAGGADDLGDGTAVLTINTNDYLFGSPIGRYIRAVDAYGAGLHYEGRLINHNYSGGKLRVTPVPSSTFSTKQLRQASFNRVVFGSTMQNLAATISADGTQVRISDAFFMSAVKAGTIIRIAGVPGLAGEHVRKTTAVNSSNGILTLDRAIPWQRLDNPNNYNSIDGTTTTGRMPLPACTVTCNFPLVFRAGPNIHPLFQIDRVEGGTITLSNLTLDINALQHPGVAAGQTTQRGTLIEAGTIDYGFFVAVGDTLRIDAPVHVDAHKMAGNLLNLPSQDYQYMLAGAGEYARRGVGYRPGAVSYV
jgi:hypothetical protein